MSNSLVAERRYRDLCQIPLRALQKEPSERYATAAEFSNDLIRYLNNEPVHAQQPSTWYRAKKFVRRHRLGVAASVTVLAAGLVGDYFSFEAVEADNRDGGPAMGGQFIMAMSPEVLAGSDWSEHSESFLTRLEQMDGVRIPGQRRFANRRDGGPRQVNAELVESLRAMR